MDLKVQTSTTIMQYKKKNGLQNIYITLSFVTFPSIFHRTCQNIPYSINFARSMDENLIKEK